VPLTHSLTLGARKHVRESLPSRDRKGAGQAFSFLLASALVFGPTCFAADQKCEESITASDGFQVRSWQVQTRWGATAALSSAITSDHAYSPDKVSKAVEEVRNALLPQLDFDLASHGGFSILFVSSCVEKVGGNQVDVVITPYMIRVDLIKIGSNILPVPHFNKPATLAPKPSLLARFTPNLGVDNDRREGTSANLAFSTDLLDLFANKSVADKLLLDGSGSKAFDNDFYKSDVKLSYSHAPVASNAPQIQFLSTFASEHQPRGNDDYLENALRFGGQILLSPRTGVFRKVLMGGNYRWSSNRLYSSTSPAVLTSENGFEFRSLADARIAGGMARFAGWFDGGSPSRMKDAYQRGVVFAGYARDIPVAQNQTFGVETLFGAGHTWGSAPQYARFFGGNQQTNFLYDSLGSTSLASMPLGPILRSYGIAQFGAGGTSFWNFNLNVSVPVPKLSTPLIPAVDTPIGPLSGLIKRQAVNSAKSFLTSFYKSQGADDKKAAAQADADLREIKPAVNYLADYANLFALKPLFLYDVGGLSGQKRQAIGGGIQFTLVVARFEAGYMRTINPLPHESSGNFVLRLTFENLF